MKLKYIYITIALFVVSFGMYGQTLFDTFSDSNFTETPVWGGSTTAWGIQANSDAAAGATGSNTLRLAAPATAQTDYLSSQISTWDTSQEWGFWLGRRAQAFTAANQAYFWLYANEANLISATVDGYRIAIGDDSGGDEIRLEYIVNGVVSSTVITSSGSITNGRIDFGILIRVKRSSAGAWEILTSTLPASNGAGAIATDIPNSTNANTSQGTATNNTIVPATNGYIGVAALHSTGANAIITQEFDQIYFTTDAADVTAPTVTTLSPADGATGVTTTSNLALTFNENIVKGTGNILIKRSSDNTTFETIDVTSGLVTISGATATINPSGTLANSTGYYVEIPNTAFKDAANNFYLGISGATAWNFTTAVADVTAPTVTTLSPADGATGVTTTSNLVLTFNENVVVGTAGNIVIYNSNNSVFETIPYNDARITFNGTTGVTINPTGTFVNSASYYVQIGSSAIRDVALNNYSGISNATDWNFTTVAAVVGAIWANTITGTNPNVDNPYITGQTVDANITVSGISRGSGITGNIGNDRYNATTWNTGALDANDYFEFTLTPNAGYKINMASFVYTGSASGSGPTNFAFRSNIDGFIADIGTATTGTTISLSAAAYQNQVTAVTFRFYAWGGTGGTYSINDFTFNGSVSVAGPTLVTSAATLSSFSYVAGAGPSSSQTFNLSAVSLTGFPADITVNGSANYEVSTDNSSFGASRTVAYTSATLAATPIYVRLKSGLIAGIYNGETISISGGGATTVNVTCSGSVVPPFYRSRQSGAWTAADSWETSSDNSIFTTATVAPTNAVTAITILNNHNISINTGAVTADDITIATGGTLTISGGTFILNNGLATNDLQVNGTLTYNGGTFTQGASGIAFGENSTYNHAVASTAIPIATWDVASNCVVTVIPPSTLNNIGQSYGNFTWNCTGQTAFFNINSSDFAVRGLFRVLSTGTQNLSMAGTTAGTYANTINAASIEGGVFAIAFSASVISTTTITNDFSISGGEVRINGANGTGTLHIGRDLLMSGTGYLNPLFLSTSLSTTINIARDLTMSGNSSINFESLDISGSVTVINVGRNFTSTSAGAISDTIVLDFGGASTSGIVAGNALNIAGNFSFTGTGQMQTTSSNTPTGIVFNGAGTKTFTYTTPITLDWVPITINTGTTLQLQNSFSIGESTVAPVTTITVNGALNFQTFAITAFTSTVPRFNTNAGATLITANTAGIGGTGTTGSLRGFGSVAATTPANGKIVFLAGTNYTFNGATTTPFPTAFGNPATINVNAAITSNMTSGLTITSAFNVNNGGAFTLNPTTNSLTLNNNAALTINTGGTFDNGGENQIFNGGGSPTINISGTFITKDVQGFVGDNTAIPGITPTLNTGSTVEYGFAGNQAVQGGRSYNNITISNGGTKTLSSAITSGNTITGTVTIKDASILNVGDKTFGGAGTNLTMTGTAEYQTAGTGTKPDAEGTYNLGVGTKVTFTSGSIASPVATMQSIRISSPTVNYYNIDIVGNNVGTTAMGTTGTNIKMQANGTFTVKSTGTFKHSNTAGFNGGALTAIDNTNAPIITLESGSTIEYAGANQTITPFTNTIVPTPVYTDSNRSYSNLIVSGTGTKTIASNSEILVGNELLVTGGTLQIDSNKLLTVNNAIKNTSGSPILVKNSGNLVQVANVDNANSNNNTGNITMTRTSRNMPNVYDYIYWGSPVKGNVFSQIPSSVYDVSYYWKLTGAAEGFWDSLSTTSPGQGFISRVKPGGTGAKDFDFTGIPNNGTVLVAADGYDTDFNLDTTGNTILLANPYPCAINAEAFIDANGLLDGNLYFWTASTVPGDYYQQDDYATWNRSGSVGTKATTDSSGNDNLRPSGKIAAGQGFFADFHADGNVTFNNAMRIRTTNDNSQFFKTTKSNKVNEQKSRVWLNLSNTKKAFRQMLVAYLSNATNGFDRSYDAESFTGNEIDIYSIVENKSLVIQGRALPLDDADIVTIGIAITNAGEYNIAIDEVDGLMTNKAIYLEDKLLNKTHNLTEGAYAFTTASGTFNNRFVLRYTDATLGTKDPKLVENQVLVFTKDKKIKVNSAIENINTVTVYDLLGRQLFKNNKVNNKEFTLSNLVAKQQLLLVKVLLDNGETLSKKVLF